MRKNTDQPEPNKQLDTIHNELHILFTKSFSKDHTEVDYKALEEKISVLDTLQLQLNKTPHYQKVLLLQSFALLCKIKLRGKVEPKPAPHVMKNYALLAAKKLWLAEKLLAQDPKYRFVHLYLVNHFINQQEKKTFEGVVQGLSISPKHAYDFKLFFQEKFSLIYEVLEHLSTHLDRKILKAALEYVAEFLNPLDDKPEEYPLSPPGLQATRYFATQFNSRVRSPLLLGQTSPTTQQTAALATTTANPNEPSATPFQQVTY